MLKMLLVVTLGLGFVVAQEEGGFVEEGAHEHGAALLNVVQEADVLSVEFISPAVNIVGFEYQPSSDEDMAAHEAATTDLADAMTLFAPSSAAGCELMSAEVETELAEEHAEHSDDEEHGDEEHEGEEHADDEAETHSEFHATYEFTCENAAELSGLELAELFTLYPGIEDLDVQYVLDSAQGAAELSAGATQLTF